jgi:hypothetical protein
MARLIRITSQHRAPHHTRLASRAPITPKTQTCPSQRILFL